MNIVCARSPSCWRVPRLPLAGPSWASYTYLLPPLLNISIPSIQTQETSTLARANSAARFDKVILIYDSLFILLKSLTLNIYVVGDSPKSPLNTRGLPA
jgi:hypothetical protein